MPNPALLTLKSDKFTSTGFGMQSSSARTNFDKRNWLILSTILSHAISEKPTNISNLNLINDGYYPLIKRAKIDSGADENVAKTTDNLVESTVYKFQQNFESCEGNIMKSTHIGDMNQYVTNVRVIPSLTSDLVSTKKLQAKECAILKSVKTRRRRFPARLSSPWTNMYIFIFCLEFRHVLFALK